MAEHDYIQETPTQRLSRWIFSEMMRGAAYAAMFVLGLGLLLWGIYLVGLLLPEDSKTAPGPMPYSAISAPVDSAKA